MAKFLITKDNDERLIDESRWNYYKAQGYRKSAEVLAEMKKAAGAKDTPVVGTPTKRELLARCEELGIEIQNPSKTNVSTLVEMIAAKESESKDGDGSEDPKNSDQ